MFILLVPYVSYYFLTYYAKMLFNLVSGIDSQLLHFFILDKAGSVLYEKAKIDEFLNLGGAHEETQQKFK